MSHFLHRAAVSVAVGAVVVAPLVVGARAAAQQRGPGSSDLLVSGRSIEQPQPSAYPLEVPADLGAEILPVFGNVYMIARPSGNVVVQVGRDGVFVVDTGAEATAEKTLQAISIITRSPIQYVLNTTPDRDFYGGNEKVAGAGRNPTVAPQGLTGPVVRLGDAPAAGRGGGGIQRAQTAIILAHENLLNRISAPTGVAAAEPVDFWPTNTFFTARKALWYNDEAVEIIHEPAAHTDGDVMAFFRRSDVIAAGPFIDTLAYPVPDAKRGGSITGILKGLNDIIDIAVPKYNQQGGTRIAPGRGRILNEADVVEYRDMMTIIRNRVKEGVDKGQTLQQVQAIGPTLEYDPLYSTPKLTGQQLVEAIYTDLKAASAPAPARR
jgi:cyclase